MCSAKITPKKRAAFLRNLAEFGNISLAAKAAGVLRRTPYDWRERDPVFAQEWDDALEQACDLLELEARRRALHGCDKPVFYQGEQCGVIREYSDTLAIVLLKAHRPDKFRENIKTEQSITHEFADLTNDELLERARRLLAGDGAARDVVA
jgi:hypothetical protein